MKVALLCSLAVTSLHAASFIQVTCNSPTGVTPRLSATATSSTCSALDPGTTNPFDRGGSTATGSVTLQMAATPSQFSILSTSQSAAAYQTNQVPPGATFGPGSSATIAIDYTTTIHTAGAVRSGFLQIGPNTSATANFYYDGISTMVSGFGISPVPLSSGNPNTTVASCSSAPSPNPCDTIANFWQNIRGLIPVTLGTDLSLFARGSTTDTAIGIDGTSSGNLQTSFQFRFFEADGVTPVAASEVPEPASWGLLLCGLALVGTVVRRRRA